MRLPLLLEPHPRIIAPPDRRGARLMGILMLIHIGVVAAGLLIINAIWKSRTGTPIWGDRDAWVVLAGVGLIAVSFILLKAGFYRAGSILYILNALAVALVAPFVPDPNAEIALLASAIIPIFLTAIVFSDRWVLLTIFGTAALAIFQLSVSGMPTRQISTGFGLLVVVVVTGTLVLVFRRHFSAIEKDRLSQIEESEKKYRNLFETVSDGIYIADTHGKIVEANSAACRQLGYTRGELLTLSIKGVMGRAAADVEALQDEVYKKGYVFVETTHLLKNGGTIPVELAVTATEFNGQRAILSVARDLTERNRIQKEKSRLEEQLQQSSKMESIGRLAGGVAHDFNNLLTTILGNVQLALNHLPGESTLSEYLIDIRNAAEIAASLTRQLLAFSRRQIIEPQLVDLNDLLTRLQKMLTRLIGEDVALKTSLSKGLGTVKVDPGLMEQVIINLSVNARDAMPDGGTLLLETANVSAANFLPADASTTNETSGPGIQAQHPLLDPGEYVVLSVIDFGTGIPPEVRTHLFEPFYTTKSKGRGTGLGLATTYGAVKQSGGHIDVQSEEGKGTTFKIFLPRVDDLKPEQSQSGSRTVRAPQSRSETILLVEDDSMVRNLAIKMLEHHGYRVLQAADGDEALLVAARYSEPIHLLMTDLVMPGMNGRQLAEHFIKNHPETRVLMSSGYTENVITHHGVLEEGVSFISKPYTLQAIGEKVRQVLDRS